MLQTLAPERTTSTGPSSAAPGSHLAASAAGLPLAACAAERTRAMAGYAMVSLEARVATASPHELVMLLYRGLVARLREAHEAVREGNVLKRLKATERALVLVEGLDASLDTRRGGSVAESLQMVYELLRTRLLAGEAQSLGEALSSAEAIADAWSNIRPA